MSKILKKRDDKSTNFHKNKLSSSFVHHSVIPVFSITVSSTGPAVEKHSSRLGQYILIANQTVHGRPVYKKTDRNYYIYYTSKFTIL